MAKQLAIRAIDWVLSSPVAFGLQQRLCNDYSQIRTWFEPVITSPGIKLLDVGCSVGTCAGQIVDMRRIDYTGIDISPDYIKKASERYPDGKFFAMDASKLDFPDAHFDVMMFVCVLHHMSSDLVASCLKDLKRVLKPGGVILVAEPVFTPGKLLSNFLLHLDRGRYIRPDHGYRQLFDGFTLVREGYVMVTPHRIHMTEWRL